MSKRSHAHDGERVVRPRPPETLDSFNPPPEPEPLGIRTPVPSAPGSDTSALAADAMDGPKRSKELRRVLLWFASQSQPRTTHEMAEILYPETGTGSACPRVNELVFHGCLERVGKQGKRSTLVITSKGFAKAAALSRQEEAA